MRLEAFRAGALVSAATRECGDPCRPMQRTMLPVEELGVVSKFTPAPGRNALDIVREVRVPGGETLYDRETRLLRLRSRAPT